MHNISLIEEHYKRYIKKLPYLLPEGIVRVDLKLLNELNLLHFHDSKYDNEDALTSYFHVVESPEKITLINDQFVIWIVPDNKERNPSTHALIALNHADHPILELAFTASGVYNTSWLVLRVLEKFLADIKENEDLLNQFKKAS